LGAAKAGNIVMLGALMESTGLLDDESIQAALRRLVKSQKWYDMDLAALDLGRQAIRKCAAPVNEADLWAV
jgi:Pyruvate/2-oxoacid:ferredoxin oxidoreductase gamma subunit